MTSVATTRDFRHTPLATVETRTTLRTYFAAWGHELKTALGPLGLSYGHDLGLSENVGLIFPMK